MKGGLATGLATGLAAGLAAGLGALAWALVEARAYTLREFDVPILPVGSNRIRLLHISDLHMLPRDAAKVAWVQGLAATRPDIVITTGDNLAHPQALTTVLEALSPFLDLPGAFVTGSNDFYRPIPKNPFKYFRITAPVARPRCSPNLPAAELISALRRSGWQYLDNERGSITVGGLVLDLVGTADAHIDDDRYPPPVPCPPGAAARIGVTHAPYHRVLDAMRADGVNLALAGHTHGGQVCLPGYGALVTNCDLHRRMARGLHCWPDAARGRAGSERMWLHVSAGLGTSPYTPIRLACRPEASLITLTAT